MAVPLLTIRQPDEELTTSDSRFLEVVSSRQYHVAFNLHPAGFITCYTTISAMGPRWPNFTYASKAFRFATLAFGSSYYKPNNYRPTYNYLAKFHKYIKEAIEQSSLMEVLVASYAAVMCSLQIQEDLEKILKFVAGVCQTATLLQSDRQHSPNHLETIRTVDIILLGSVETLRMAYFISRDPCANVDIDLLGEMHTILQHVCTWHCGQFPYRSQLYETNTFARLVKLDLYMKFHLDYYLAVMSQSSSDNEILRATASLRQVLSQIIETVPQMPKAWKVFDIALDESRDWPWLTGQLFMEVPQENLDFECLKTAFIFGFAWLLKEIIGEPENHFYTDASSMYVAPAIFLCRLYALRLSHITPEWRCIIRNIFWAGIGLRRGVDRAGTIQVIFLLTI